MTSPRQLAAYAQESARRKDFPQAELEQAAREGVAVRLGLTPGQSRPRLRVFSPPRASIRYVLSVGRWFIRARSWHGLLARAAFGPWTSRRKTIPERLAMKAALQDQFTWRRFAEPGYEVSSRGDARFSPLYAKMPDGRTIEAHYHCDIKGFEPGGVAWLKYKGARPAGKSRDELWQGFLGLWRVWAENNPRLMSDLVVRASHEGRVLTDQFATSDINQARALSVLLNERGQA